MGRGIYLSAPTKLDPWRDIQTLTGLEITQIDYCTVPSAPIRAIVKVTPEPPEWFGVHLNRVDCKARLE